MDAKQMKILIALDASPQSEAAVNYLSRLAAADRTEVLLFHVFKKHPARYWDLDHGSDEKPEAAPMEEWERVHRAGVEAFLDRSRRVFLGRGFPAEAVRVEVRDRQKGVAADITAEVRKGCDLAVVGRWGHSEAEELIFGSVAHRLMAKLTGEALGVIAGDPDPSGILIALDASETSWKALEFAARLVAGTGVRVEVFHAVRRLKLPAYVDDMSEVQAAEKRLLQDEEDFTRPIMERAASYLIEAGIPADRVETKIALGVASRAEAIVRRAREDNFGAIVLGRRRPSRLEEFFLGRVSDKVFQIARQRAVFMVG